MNNILVSSQWLNDNLENDKLVLLDASMGKVVGKEPLFYETPVFIPYSRKFCLESVFCDLDSGQVHAFPTLQQFDREVKRLGIEDDSIVVIYDNQGIYSSPRAWWIFQAMGFTNAFILDGGLPVWMEEGRPVVMELDRFPENGGNLVGTYDNRLVCDSSYVLGCLNDHSTIILDARAKDRYEGVAPEPRAGVRSGHIPTSLNLPFAAVLDGFCFKETKLLSQVFSELVPDGRCQLVFSCGSGITACIILVAARLAGFSDTVLYDGSWAEWGSTQTLPIEQ